MSKQKDVKKTHQIWSQPADPNASLLSRLYSLIGTLNDASDVLKSWPAEEGNAQEVSFGVAFLIGCVFYDFITANCLSYLGKRKRERENVRASHTNDETDERVDASSYKSSSR